MNSKIEEFCDLVKSIDPKFKYSKTSEKVFLNKLLNHNKVGNLLFDHVFKKANPQTRIELVNYLKFFNNQPNHNIDLRSLSLKIGLSNNFYDIYKILISTFTPQLPILEELKVHDEEIKKILINIDKSNLKNYNIDYLKELLNNELFDQEIPIEKFEKINILDNELCRDILKIYNKTKNEELKTFEKSLGAEIDLKFIQGEIDNFFEFVKKYENTKIKLRDLILDIYDYISKNRFKFIFDKYDL